MKELSLRLFKDEELLPLLLVLAAAACIICLIFRHIKDHDQDEKQNDVLQYPHLNWLRSSRRRPVWKKKDWFCLTLITALYALVSFWQLGSSVFPTTTWQPSMSGQTIILELNEGTQFDRIYTIYNEGDNNSNLESLQIGTKDMYLEGSNDLQSWQTITSLDDASLYQYKQTDGLWDYRYIRITCNNKNDTLTEIGFKAAGEDRLLPVKVYEDAYSDSKYPAALLIDEQNKIAMDPDYRNESYFDEIYHPRNAWEIAEGEYMYAHVHPLLGTSLIALSIRLFGMNPLAWRIPGAIFGVMLVPLFYAILKLLFEKCEYAAMGAALLACDFMHLTTSRIATLEPFSVFWILLMFYFMIRYFYTSFYDTDYRKTLKLLFFSGLFMGIGIATKWTACYSAVGLAVLLFTNLIRRCYEYHKAQQVLGESDKETAYTSEELEACRHIVKVWKHYFWHTIAWCFLFFIGIPIVIYWGSYLWCPVWRDGWSISNVWSQIEYMYNYHINLKATHPYQSYWYQWILDIRPIWYYGRQSHNGIYHSIACFSNPLICWAGLVSIIVVIADVFYKRNREAWVIAVGYLTAFLPWVLLVNRCVFAYHFYPTSFFMIMAVVYVFRALIEWKKSMKSACIIFIAACAVIFFMFLPATAGFGTVNSYIKFLEWLPMWYFG